jgi:hypothetical protein
MVHQLIRTELYELVWSVPMTRVAKRLGISDVGLAKACRRAGIPVPERGYWAKSRHGKKVQRKPLPPVRSHGQETIVIVPPELKPPLPKLELPPEVQRQVEQESAPERRIQVTKTLSNPYPIIGAWLEQERRARDAWRASDLNWPRQYAKSIEKRRLRILSTLFKELEKRGFKPTVEAGNPYWVFVYQGEEKIEFTLKERERQRRMELAKEEKKDPYNLGRAWKQVREATGELAFRIRSLQYSSAQAEWRDDPDHPLEDQLNAIVAGFFMAGEVLRRHRLGRQEAERRYAEAERERWEQEERHRKEAERVQELLRCVSAWRQAAEIRAYVEAVRTTDETTQQKTGTAHLDEWASWALAQADRLDPLLSTDRLSES